MWLGPVTAEGGRRAVSVAARIALWVLAGTASGAAAACQKEAGANAAEEDVPRAELLCVETAAVVESVERPTIDVPGNVLPMQKLIVFPRVPGTIVEITKDKGDPVTAGELLLRIDSKPYEDAVRQVEAQLNVAQVAASGAASTLSTIRPQLERLERLLGEGVVPQSQVDSVRTDVEAAGVGARSARAQAQMAEVGLDIARDRLADTEVRAPFGGVVAERLADVGTIAQPMPPTPVLVILDISRVKVEGAVSELQFGRVDREGRVDVVLDAYPDDPVPARIAAVMPALDPETRSVRFSVTLDNDGRFRPAMAATLRLPTLAQTWTVVPREALLGDPASGSATLFVVDSRGAVEERRVSVLDRAEDRIRVDGVQAGERVAITGVERMRDGVAVCPPAPRDPAPDATTVSASAAEPASRRDAAP